MPASPTATATAGLPTPAVHGSGALSAFSAAAVTVPHALALGLLAYGPLASGLPVGALALWSAALPIVLLAFTRPPGGVVHAPTTVVALLFATVVATVSRSAGELGLDAAQVLAVSGLTAALGFAFQWLFGVLRLASLARFLPISVMHGFAAGVAVSMIAGQAFKGFGAGHWAWDAVTARNAVVALGVVLVAWLVQRRWRYAPGLMIGVAALSLAVHLAGAGTLFQPAAPAAGFIWPPLPDWSGVPWVEVAQAKGLQLLSLAMLMAIINGLDIVVFNQELVMEHGVPRDANDVLRRESVVGVLCGLCGLIPASTSGSRSRLVLRQAGPSRAAGPMHAALLLGVAATGHWWLSHVPMAALSGGLVVAGLLQIPRVMWSPRYARRSPAAWGQSWLVTLVFALSGGVGALAAGMLVSTFVLLHASASTALRRAFLDGQLRSRRLRRQASEAWLSARIDTVAVFQLQGLMSFGAAAYIADRVLGQLQPRHRRVILDASRVPGWDATAQARLAGLARDLALQQRLLAVCGLDPRATAAAPEGLLVFADLDRALEWAEDGLLEDMPAGHRLATPAPGPLGELAEGISDEGLRALKERMRAQEVGPHAPVFLVDDDDTDVVVVQQGRVTLSTEWPLARGLRLATIGQGMTFGEMAFLNKVPRAACAGTEGLPARVLRLARQDFDDWSSERPGDALVFMRNLARIGTRRLAATTRQLRSALE